MAARLNISIPDELQQRLQRVKEAIGDEVNISGVCQIAIEKELIFLEEKAKAVSSKQKSIARLKVQKQQYESVVFNLGKQNGYRYAESGELHYGGFRTTLSTQLIISIIYDESATLTN